MPSKSKQTLTIVYVSNTRLPTEKAHGLALAKLSEAFADVGLSVDIVAPLLWRKRGADYFDYYRVKRNVRLTFLPTIDLIPLHVVRRFAFVLQMLAFSLAAYLYCKFHYRGRSDVVFFSHDYIPLYFLSFLPQPIFYDIHHFPGTNFMYERVLSKSRIVAVQTKWKIQALSKQFRIEPHRVIYWPNGTDVEAFARTETVREARRALGLPEEGRFIVYTGQLFQWKGVQTVIRALEFLPVDVHLYLVGGAAEDVERIKREEPCAYDPRLHFIASQPHETMPLWLRAADVLVLPNTATQKVSRWYTSPMKLFEYMASGRPMVASDIPSIREVVSEADAFFATPDDPNSFAAQIEQALSNSTEGERRAVHAQEAVRQFSWRERALRLSDHFKTL